MTSLKRHEVLQPLSRDHVIGLHQAQLLQKAAGLSVQEQERAITNFGNVWQDEIHPHFRDEERILPAFIVNQDSVSRLFEDHSTISKLVNKVMTCDQPVASALSELGQLLDTHIRWEEHNLFPEIEAALTPASEPKLKALTDAIELSRHRHSGKYKRQPPVDS